MADSNLTSTDITELEEQLNSFSLHARQAALYEISRRIESGDIKVPQPKAEVNLHFHTFFSFNAYGWSPSRIAWEARKYGLIAAGIVDFDVLDGLDEFLAAGEIIDIPTAVALETRVFINEYSDKVINSPNEPGISYFMSAGHFKQPDKGSNAEKILQSMRDMARRRNLQVMEKVNDYLDMVRLDYDTDVLPLTPSGNATERHMLAAYDAKARQVIGNDNEALAEFWSKALGLSNDEAVKLIANTPALHDKIRSKLMKFGGVGYAAPTPDTFPTVEQVIAMSQEIDALPTATWLDGTNPGEADMPAMLELLAGKGVVAVNIIPDRNWNIKNPDEKRTKVENLDKVVKAARDINFPLCVGTEMNKLGLPFVDNFQAPELQPYVNDFIEGAMFFWGHTLLSRYAGIGCASEWAKSNFGNDKSKKNAFYAKVGHLAGPVRSRSLLAGKDLKSATPQEVIKILGGN